MSQKEAVSEWLSYTVTQDYLDKVSEYADNELAAMRQGQEQNAYWRSVGRLDAFGELMKDIMEDISGEEGNEDETD